MKTYQITNLTSGADLGTYTAQDELCALEKMAREAGHRSYAEACEASGDEGGDLDVIEVAS